jgi:hypothetical protein
MDRTRRALEVLLCVSVPWMTGVHVHAAEASAAPREPAAANAASSNDSAQREWRDRLRRPTSTAPGNALFETKSWLPEPPPKRPVVRAPEAPTPPPFPYQFLGRLETEGKPRTVYLTKDNRVYSVAPGEVIEGTYRVVDVTAESMELMYLPLNMKQQIAFSSIVPTPPRQTSRASDTPSIVAPTSVAIPPPMNLSPPPAAPVRGGPPTAQTVPAEGPRTAQRQNNPEAAPDRPTAPQQQPGTAAAAGGTPAAKPAPAVAAPSLSPSPVIVSPPTLSAFGPAAPTTGSAPAAQTAPAAAPPSGAGAPQAPASGRM